MNILLTGGAGFIGRWVLKELLEAGHNIWVVDNLSSGDEENIKAFSHHPNLKKLYYHDINDESFIQSLFSTIRFQYCFHLASSTNTLDSIDAPRLTFENDTIATFLILEACRKKRVKMVYTSTCLVYDCSEDSGIKETSQIKPVTPYVGAKIAAENMVLSYYYAYKLPTVVLRPFPTYGPFQKASNEGGLVSTFLKKKIQGGVVTVFGDGTQTRDLLYVEDCARFIVEAGFSEKTNGEILHAGSGENVTINELAQSIMRNPNQIIHVPHIYPQTERMNLLCNYEKAKNLIGWEPMIYLQEGLARTENWMKENK